MIVLSFFLYEKGAEFLEFYQFGLFSWPGLLIVCLVLAPLGMGSGLVMAALKWPAARYFIKLGLGCLMVGLIIFGILQLH
jgi:hypothetical protein